MNTITTYLEDDGKKEVNFHKETLTFTLQSLKIKFPAKKGAYKYLKVTVNELEEDTDVLQEILMVI